MTDEEREKAIDVLEHNWTRLVNADYSEEELNTAFNTALKALKQEEPKFIAHSDGTIEQILTREHREWIPVSEGLPKCNGTYEVTIQTDEGRYTNACYFDGSDTWYNDNRINHMRAYVTDKIIAWMPKPEPYKEGSRDGA